MKPTKVISVLALVAILSGCAKKEVCMCVEPLPAGFSVDSLTDCNVPASFSVDDFNWMGGNLTMTVYNEDLYDAVEVSKLKAGDTLFYESEPMIIKSIAEENGLLSINGGLEEGGCWLQGYEGGTYRAVQFDDHSIYSELGKAHLPLADDFVITDCGENPDDPIDTVKTGQKLFIEKLDGSRKDFNMLNTRVRIERGLIKEINRHWIP